MNITKLQNILREPLLYLLPLLVLVGLGIESPSSIGSRFAENQINVLKVKNSHSVGFGQIFCFAVANMREQIAPQQIKFCKNSLPNDRLIGTKCIFARSNT